MICKEKYKFFDDREDQNAEWHLSRSILIDWMRLAVREDFSLSLYSISANGSRKTVRRANITEKIQLKL